MRGHSSFVVNCHRLGRHSSGLFPQKHVVADDNRVNYRRQRSETNGNGTVLNSGFFPHTLCTRKRNIAFSRVVYLLGYNDLSLCND